MEKNDRIRVWYVDDKRTTREKKVKYVGEDKTFIEFIDLENNRMLGIKINSIVRYEGLDKIKDTPKKTENKTVKIVELIMKGQEATKDKMVHISKIIDAAEGIGITEQTTVNIINQLKRAGELFEPDRDCIRKI